MQEIQAPAAGRGVGHPAGSKGRMILFPQAAVDRFRGLLMTRFAGAGRLFRSHDVSKCGAGFCKHLSDNTLRGAWSGARDTASAWSIPHRWIRRCRVRGDGLRGRTRTRSDEGRRGIRTSVAVSALPGLQIGVPSHAREP